MRILFLNPTMHRVGTWFRCFFLARGLVRRGHRVTLVKVSPTERFRVKRFVEDGVQIVETPRLVGSRWTPSQTRLVSDLVARSALALREPHDVVHMFAHHLNTVLPGLLSRLAPGGGPLFADWDDLWTEGGLYGGWPEQGILRRLDYGFDLLSERYAKRAARAVTVVSRALRDRAIADGVSADRVFEVGNGAPVDVIRPGDRAALRRELGLPQDASLGVFVGYGQYDVDVIFDALAQLSDRPGVRAVFTGPHAEALQKMAAERGLADRALVLGHLPFEKMCKVIAASDVGLLPYADKPLNRARWPIKLGDYLAAGLPVLTSTVGEMGRFVRQFAVGEATDPHAAAFAAGWRRLLDTGDTLRAHAREVAEANSWEAMAGKLEAVYRAGGG